MIKLCFYYNRISADFSVCAVSLVEFKAEIYH